ncbi:MAG TPA: hypothetical protein DEB09_00050 [Candidatus Magasanikbacteria bacterium]|nr:hypothetical protein [Candidatus Magasanikbacteria bacterium]
MPSGQNQYKEEDESLEQKIRPNQNQNYNERQAIQPEQFSVTENSKTESQTSLPEGVIESTAEIPKSVPENSENFLEETINNLKGKLKSSKKKPTQIPQVKDEITVQIEKIMEEGLGDAYKELTPIQKQEFKIKGEAVAWEIRNMVKLAHIKVKSIFRLLLEWLKMLPGINRFFLEQEAKIKTDKILNMHEIEKHKQ